MTTKTQRAEMERELEDVLALKYAVVEDVDADDARYWASSVWWWAACGRQATLEAALQWRAVTPLAARMRRAQDGIRRARRALRDAERRAA